MKILYTASVLSHICQFHLPVMEMLQKEGHTIHVAAKDNLAEKNGLQLKYTNRYFNFPFERSPRSKKNIIALRMLKKLLFEERYDVVICNTPVVGILTRIAAKKVRKTGTKIVYIAHGFHFYQGAPKKYWLIYPIEKWFANHRTDLLIAINEEDYRRAKQKFHCRVEHINGVGVRTERYHPITESERREYRMKLSLPENAFVLICSKELMFDNNQKTLLKAIGRLKDQIPCLRVLIAGNGPDEALLKDYSKSLGIEDIVTFLGYRTDLEKIVPACDVVVSCSYREGMPLNIIEAMLCERPVIASHNRGHDELIEDGKSGYLFSMMDDNLLAERIKDVFFDVEHTQSMGRQAFLKAQSYTAEVVSEQMRRILSSLEEIEA